MIEVNRFLLRTEHSRPTDDTMTLLTTTVSTGAVQLPEL